MDDIDRKILTELQRNADRSIDSLAEEIHLSRNACWRRVKNLEANGVIKRKVVLLDPEKIGVGLSVYVLIKTAQHNRKWLEQFHKTVRMMPEIVGAHRMSGELDYVLRVRVATVKDYDQFYQRLISHVPISDISASFVMEDIKDTTELPL